MAWNCCLSYQILSLIYYVTSSYLLCNLLAGITFFFCVWGIFFWFGVEFFYQHLTEPWSMIWLPGTRKIRVLIMPAAKNFLHYFICICLPSASSHWFLLRLLWWIKELFRTHYFLPRKVLLPCDQVTSQYYFCCCLFVFRKS